MFSLADLFVSIKADDSHLKDQLGKTKGDLSAQAVATGTAAGNLASDAIKSIYHSITGAFSDIIGSGMKAAGAVRRVDMTFGEASESVKKFADHIEEAYGQSGADAENMAAKFGMVAMHAGKGRQGAADFSVQMVETAQRLQAINPGAVSFEEAMNAVYMGTQGATRGLRQFGVQLSPQKVLLEAQAMGLGHLARAGDQAALAMARGSLMQKEFAFAAGLVDQNLAGAGGQMNLFWNRLDHVKEEIGVAVIPALKAFWTTANQALDGVMEIFSSVQPAIASVVGTLSSAWRELGTAVFAAIEPARAVLSGLVAVVVLGFPTIVSLAGAFAGHVAAIAPVAIIATAVYQAFTHWEEIAGFVRQAVGAENLAVVTRFGQAIKEWLLDKVEMVKVAWRNLPAVVEIAGLKIYETVVNIGRYFATIPENLGRIASYIAGNWRQIILDGITAVGAAFKNLGENIKNLSSSIKSFFTGGGWEFKWTPLLEGFKATADRLPEMLKPALYSADEEIRKVQDRIAKREEGRSALAKMAAHVAGGAGATGADGKPDPLNIAANELVHKQPKVEDTASFMSKLRMEQGGNDVPKKQLSELQLIRQFEKETAANMAKALERMGMATYG